MQSMYTEEVLSLKKIDFQIMVQVHVLDVLVCKKVFKNLCFPVSLNGQSKNTITF